MSAALAAVRFPDGDVRWTIYNVMDEVEPALLADRQVVLHALRERAWTADEETPHGPIFDVEIYSDYGMARPGRVALRRTGSSKAATTY